MRPKYSDETEEEYYRSVLGDWWYENGPGVAFAAVMVVAEILVWLN